MASGLHVVLQLKGCVVHKNGTHGVAVAGRARLVSKGCEVKSNQQLGLLIQSGAQADIENNSIAKNGAHGICLQLGGEAKVDACEVSRNKQTGLAVMGAASKAAANRLTSVDNGIDGCHVGQVGMQSLDGRAATAGSRQPATASG